MIAGKAILSLVDAVPEEPCVLTSPINLRLMNGENWIIYGANGSGKTQLATLLSGTKSLKSGYREYTPTHSQDACNNIAYITFHDQYRSSVDTGNSAYQMRWNQGAQNDEFEPRVNRDDPDSPTIVSLSSGEFRRFQLTEALSKQPSILIIDNPFIGLDREGRNTVATTLSRLAIKGKTSIILIASRMPETLPGFTHLIEVSNGGITKKPYPAPALPIVEIRNITVRYGLRTILKDLSLTVRQGEHWALKGANGSGKSTLLSIICADNPQAYACDISLFGRKRGTGESIWEIKKNIGFVSPEMFRAFRRNLPVKHIVASGLYDTTGLFRQPTREDYQAISQWTDTFGITQWAERNYLTLSAGEQRWVLLCRAFVKNPPLLILDEPFHGLDDSYRIKAMLIICNYFKEDATRTLIMVSHYDEDFPPIIDHAITLTTQL